MRYTLASIYPDRRRPVATGSLSVQRFMYSAVNLRYVIKILLIIFEVPGFSAKQITPDIQKCQIIQMMAEAKEGRLGFRKYDVSKKTKIKTKENITPTHRPIEDDTVCPLCAECREEDWIQCGNFKIWVHETCANISELSDQYICDYCTV